MHPDAGSALRATRGKKEINGRRLSPEYRFLEKSSILRFSFVIVAHIINKRTRTSQEITILPNLIHTWRKRSISTRQRSMAGAWFSKTDTALRSISRDLFMEGGEGGKFGSCCSVVSGNILF